MKIFTQKTSSPSGCSQWGQITSSWQKAHCTAARFVVLFVLGMVCVFVHVLQYKRMHIFRESVSVIHLSTLCVFLSDLFCFLNYFMVVVVVVVLSSFVVWGWFVCVFVHFFGVLTRFNRMRLFVHLIDQYNYSTCVVLCDHFLFLNWFYGCCCSFLFCRDSLCEFVFCSFF